MADNIKSITWPVIPVVPPAVLPGGKITSAQTNSEVKCLADLWTDLQAVGAASVSDPTTTKGDLLVRTASALARLPVGADTTILLADASQSLGIRWSTIASVAVPLTRRVNTGAGLQGGGALSADLTLTADVTSVNGHIGAVVLTPADISSSGGVPATRRVVAGAGMSGGGALSADVTLNALVTSVFGRTGDVVLYSGDLTAAGAVTTARKITTSTGLSGGGDLSADRILTVVDDSTIQRVRVSNAGALLGTRREINFIPGPNVGISIADNVNQNRVDVTIASTGGGSGGGAQTPWIQDVDAFRYSLLNASYVETTFNAGFTGNVHHSGTTYTFINDGPGFVLQADAVSGRTALLSAVAGIGGDVAVLQTALSVLGQLVYFEGGIRINAGALTFADGSSQTSAAVTSTGTPLNTPNALVQRDGTGAFTAGTSITAEGVFVTRPTAKTDPAINSELGGLRIQGWQGGISTSRRAVVAGYAAENWTAAAQGSYLAFETCPLGSVAFREVARLSAAGNLMVGTTADTGQRLQVNGSVQSMAGGFVFPDATVQATAATSTPLTPWATDIDAANHKLYGVNRLGIGNSSPQALLHITGANAAGLDKITGILLERTYDTVGDTMDIVWPPTARISANATGGGESALIFYAQTGAGDGTTNEIMRMNGSHSVVVNGRILSTAYNGHCLGFAGGGLQAIPQTNASLMLYNNSASNWNGMGADAGGNMWFRTGTSGTPNARIVILANGSVAIGRTVTYSVAENIALQIGSMTTGTDYGTAAIQVRESLGGEANTDPIYTPRIAFNWAQAVTSQISMDGGGNIRVLNGAGTATVGFYAANFNGFTIHNGADKPAAGQILATAGDSYTYTGYINSTVPTEDTAPIGYAWFGDNTATPNFIRRCSIARFGSQLPCIMWSNYATSAGHYIIDASSGFAPNANRTVIDKTNAATAWAPSYPTLMGFNGTSTYGVRVDACRYSDSSDYNGLLNRPDLIYNGYPTLFRLGAGSNQGTMQLHNPQTGWDYVWDMGGNTGSLRLFIESVEIISFNHHGMSGNVSNRRGKVHLAEQSFFGSFTSDANAGAGGLQRGDVYVRTDGIVCAKL